MMKRSNWHMEARGWWLNDSLVVAVCRESDGKWHSYATENDRVKNTVGFKTMAEAMADAEKRAR